MESGWADDHHQHDHDKQRRRKTWLNEFFDEIRVSQSFHPLWKILVYFCRRKSNFNMGHITILLIAVGLSFDTFAVSVSSGLTIRHIRFLQAAKIALTLALFQSMMPLLGWFLGSQVSGLIINYDHWVAFGLLSFLGLKMAYESLKKDKENSNFNPLNLMVLLGMAVATSIDALVVGVSFA